MDERPADQEQARGLCATLGGAIDPVVSSVLHWRPAALALVCSTRSLAGADRLRERIEEAQPDRPRLRVRTFVVEDEASLLDAHERAREAIAWLREQGICDPNLRVDYTGGTKSMSAGAVLAAAPARLRFHYVTGRRDRGGLGTVETGTERVVDPPNPWAELEEMEVRRVLTWFSRFQWAPARELALERAGRRAERHTTYDLVAELAVGLDRWDHFDHTRAWARWRNGRAPEKLLGATGGHALLERFAEWCRELLPLLDRARKARRARQPPSGEGPDPLVLDLLANAERRAALEQWDEAVLRVYRTIELSMQRGLLARGIDNGSVAPEDVPDPELRRALERRHGPRGDRWKLGLADSAALLAAHGDTVGTRVRKAVEARRLDTTRRNESWLVHGTGHTDRRRYEAFRDEVLRLLGTPLRRLPTWPPLEVDSHP